MISAALAVLIGRSPKGDTSQRFQTLWPRGRRMPTSWSCCVWSSYNRWLRPRKGGSSHGSVPCAWSMVT